MKKLFILFLVTTLSLSSYAGLKEKHVIGKWTYKVELDQETLTGFLEFEKKEGKLEGRIITENGETYSFTKIEIKEENILYLELKPEYDLIVITLKVEDGSYTGTGSTYNLSVTMTGEKMD